MKRFVHSLNFLLVLLDFDGWHGGLMVRALDSGFKPWRGSLHCALGQGT